MEYPLLLPPSVLLSELVESLPPQVHQELSLFRWSCRRGILLCAGSDSLL